MDKPKPKKSLGELFAEAPEGSVLVFAFNAPTCSFPGCGRQTGHGGNHGPGGNNNHG